MGHRNYAAGVLGRFISRDPIGHAGNLNLYAYPTNPVNMVDPSGLNEEWWESIFKMDTKPGDPRRYLDFMKGADGIGIECDNQPGSGNYKPVGNAPKRGMDGKMYPTDPGWDQSYNEYLKTNKLDSEAALKGGTRANSSNYKLPSFKMNMVLFGPLKFLNFVNNVNDAQSIYQTLCDGPGGPLKIPTIYRDSSNMSQEEYTESRLNDRVYFFGWNIFQTRTIGPYDSI